MLLKVLACGLIYMTGVVIGTVLDTIIPMPFKPGKLFMFWAGMAYIASCDFIDRHHK